MNGKRNKGGFWVNRLPAFLAGLLLGGMAGAAAMLLLAPRSGKRHGQIFRSKAQSCAIRRLTAWMNW